MYRVKPKATIWCNNFDSLDEILRKTKNTIYLTPEKFEQYRFLIDVYAREHGIDIRWEIPEFATCHYIISEENQHGYLEIATHIWELLSTDSTPELLVRHFDRIANVTLPILRIIVMYVSRRIHNHDTSRLVQYLTSHDIDDEIVVSYSVGILYYKLGSEETNRYVLNWLKTSISIQGKSLQRVLWYTNWSYYSSEVQQELTVRFGEELE